MLFRHSVALDTVTWGTGTLSYVVVLHFVCRAGLWGCFPELHGLLLL
jgi:hypothetical protein